jgi:hypothetical protein
MKVKELKDYKSSLFASLSRNLSEFEKNFLLISGGILAFSITFIKEIVKIESASNITFLFISWAFIIISIGLMMYAFLRSSLASDELWALVDKFILKDKLFNDEQELSGEQITEIKFEVNNIFYESKKKLKYLRFISVGTFLVGLIFLSIYVSINLTQENKLANKNSYEIKSSNDTIELSNDKDIIKVIIKNKNYETKTDSSTTKTSKKRRTSNSETTKKR